MPASGPVFRAPDTPAQAQVRLEAAALMNRIAVLAAVHFGPELARQRRAASEQAQVTDHLGQDALPVAGPGLAVEPESRVPGAVPPADEPAASSSAWDRSSISCTPSSRP